MKIVKKHGIMKSKMRVMKPYRVILHHTAGGSLAGAEATLVQRGLGYHYMIDWDGTVYEYVPANRWCAHAYQNNNGTIGISFVGGGTAGPAKPAQIDSCIELIKNLKTQYPLRDVSGHKHVDPRGKWSGGVFQPYKLDPRFDGEPANGVDWDIDKAEMTEIARESGLQAYLPRWKP